MTGQLLPQQDYGQWRVLQHDRYGAVHHRHSVLMRRCASWSTMVRVKLLISQSRRLLIRSWLCSVTDYFVSLFRDNHETNIDRGKTVYQVHGFLLSS